MPHFTDKHRQEIRPILVPTGNRVRAVEELTEKKPKRVISLPSANGSQGVRCKASVDNSSNSSSTFSSSTSSSSSSGLGAKNSTITAKLPRKSVAKNSDGFNKPAKIVPDGIQIPPLSSEVRLAVRRCDWITPNSEPLYTTFHDEEWGVPVHDDTKLFELLVLSQALAEFSMPVILGKRPTFRRLFDEFDPASVANLEEERLLSIRVLSEQKLRAVVENARQLLKIQQQYGSFSAYCWDFVNHKPIKSGLRHARQVPTRTPKSELISRDLMQRGFLCVGPTVVYSFMQMAGLVNDHLLTCFRHKEASKH